MPKENYRIESIVTHGIGYFEKITLSGVKKSLATLGRWQE